MVHQLLKHLELWNEEELIYWIDPNGNPLELASDLDLGNMVFAAHNARDTLRARENVVKGSNVEQVLCTLLVICRLLFTLTMSRGLVRYLASRYIYA